MMWLRIFLLWSNTRILTVNCQYNPKDSLHNAQRKSSLVKDVHQKSSNYLKFVHLGYLGVNFVYNWHGLYGFH